MEGRTRGTGFIFVVWVEMVVASLRAQKRVVVSGLWRPPGGRSPGSTRPDGGSCRGSPPRWRRGPEASPKTTRTRGFASAFNGAAINRHDGRLKLAAQLFKNAAGAGGRLRAFDEMPSRLPRLQDVAGPLLDALPFLGRVASTRAGWRVPPSCPAGCRARWRGVAVLVQTRAWWSGRSRRPAAGRAPAVAVGRQDRPGRSSAGGACRPP